MARGVGSVNDARPRRGHGEAESLRGEAGPWRGEDEAMLRRDRRGKAEAVRGEAGPRRCGAKPRRERDVVRQGRGENKVRPGLGEDKVRPWRCEEWPRRSESWRGLFEAKRCWAGPR